MKKRLINWKVLIVSLVVVYAIAFLGSIFTSPVTDSEWYGQIKPAITPPSYVFPIVWNVLFFFIALSLYFAWINSDKDSKIKLMYVFAINLLLNLLWSVLFFGLKNPVFAFYDLIGLWFSIMVMIIIVFKINKISGYLLIPYFLWVSFVGVLNYLMVFR